MSVWSIDNVCWSDVCSSSSTFVEVDDVDDDDEEDDDEEGKEEEGELVVRRRGNTLELNVNAQTILAALHSFGDDARRVCNIACAFSSPRTWLFLYAADCIRRWVRNDVL